MVRQTKLNSPHHFLTNRSPPWKNMHFCPAHGVFVHQRPRHQNQELGDIGTSFSPSQHLATMHRRNGTTGEDRAAQTVDVLDRLGAALRATAQRKPASSPRMVRLESQLLGPSSTCRTPSHDSWDCHAYIDPRLRPPLAVSSVLAVPDRSCLGTWTNQLRSSPLSAGP